MLNISAFFVGLIFGLGLIVSGMTNPAKVIGFLDLDGAWDPSLAFVMGGAILIGSGGFANVLSAFICVNPWLTDFSRLRDSEITKIPFMNGAYT